MRIHLKIVPFKISCFYFRGRFAKRIAFYQGKNLHTSLELLECEGGCSYVYLSSPYPGSHVLFWTAAETVLQYDCSKGDFRLKRTRTPMAYGLEEINGMCCIEGGDGLVFLTKDGLEAYETKTGDPKWKIPLQDRSMKETIGVGGFTVDSHGHLFMCDTNNECVHIFAETTGQSVGVILNKDSDIGIPHKIGWNQNSKTLVVLHKKNGTRFHITVVTVKWK